MSLSDKNTLYPNQFKREKFLSTFSLTIMFSNEQLVNESREIERELVARGEQGNKPK